MHLHAFAVLYLTLLSHEVACGVHLEWKRQLHVTILNLDCFIAVEICLYSCFSVDSLRQSCLTLWNT